MSKNETSIFISSCGGEPQTFTVDASLYWQGFSEKLKCEQYDEMRGDFFWQVMSPHLTPSGELGEAFISAFLQGKNRREETLAGAKEKKRVEEEFLYQMAVGIYLTDHPLNQFEEDPEKYEVKDHEGRSWGKQEFSLELSKLIAEGNHESLQKITDITKARKTSEDSHETYQNLRGNWSKDGVVRPQWGETLVVQRWKEFCDHVIENCQLPSVTQLNRLWGSGNKTTQYREELGLDGIPKK